MVIFFLCAEQLNTTFKFPIVLEGREVLLGQDWFSECRVLGLATFK